MEFLEVKREHSEVFEKSWAMHVKQVASLKEEAQEEQDDGSTLRNKETKGKPQETKGKPQGKASSKPSPRTQVHAEPSSKTPTGGKKLKDLLVKCNKTKMKINTALAQAQGLLFQIESGMESWRFAHNDENSGSLKRAQVSLQSRMTAFDMEFLVKKAEELKNSYGHEHLLVNLEKFQELSTEADHVVDMLRTLTAMHSVRARQG